MKENARIRIYRRDFECYSCKGDTVFLVVFPTKDSVILCTNCSKQAEYRDKEETERTLKTWNERTFWIEVKCP